MADGRIAFMKDDHSEKKTAAEVVGIRPSAPYVLPSSLPVSLPLSVLFIRLANGAGGSYRVESMGELQS